MKIRIKKKTLEETSGVAGMAGFAGRVPHDEHKLDELYSSSGINMMGAGLKQIDPTPEQEEERQEMNLVNKGLKNYKKNHYFVEESDKKQRKIKITIKKH